MRTAISNGINFSTAYSGSGADATGCFLMQIQMERCGFLPYKSIGFKWLHAGDIMPECVAVLKSYDKKWRPEHITNNLLDRLPADVRAEIENSVRMEQAARRRTAR